MSFSKILTEVQHFYSLITSSVLNLRLPSCTRLTVEQFSFTFDYRQNVTKRYTKNVQIIVHNVEKIFRFSKHQTTNLRTKSGTTQTSERPHLTLRVLMSCIYIYIYIYMEHLFLMFLDHTQRRSTVGRTPLDE